jgi:FkbM family methyltransferase
MKKSLFKKFTSCGFAGLNAALRRFGYRVDRFDQVDFFEPLLYKRLRRSRDFFFVQIGANDGIFADPIRNFVTRNHAAGLVVEPLQDFFEKLEFNCRDFPKVRPVNVALHATLRSIQLHRVDPTKAHQAQDWTQGIASIQEEHHRNSAVPDHVMITETVPAITLTELLDQHAVAQLDLLQVDTEGYDFEILQMIDFRRIQPAIIHFEHGLSAGMMSLEQFKHCTGRLIDHGYYIITEPYDAITYQPGML